jgi:RNA polymerase sigma-54 factor
MGPNMGMGMQMRPELKQQLFLAPRMIQSMEILQLAAMALQERIQEELQANPVLEQREQGAEEGSDGETQDQLDLEAETAAVNEAANPEKELVIDDKHDEEDFDRLLAINEDWSDHFNEEHRPSSNRIDEESDKKHVAEANMASRPQSLNDFLTDQLTFLDAPDEQLKLARHVISHLDANGWLATPLEEIAKTYESLVSVEQVEQALHLVQKLDPPGVGARNLEECLLLQLTPETPHRDVLRLLILNHLEDIEHNRMPNIQKRTGFDLHTIQEAIEALRHLNPKPGSQFSTENVQYVVPDLAIEQNEQGDYEVRLLDDWTPNVYISRRCIELYRDKGTDPKTKEFLKRKIQAAQWLLEAIEQRRNTLLKVTRAIIQHQRAFLDHGPDHVVPLKMQQIADQVGVHVTTVSRAVDDKWVQTPRGVFPLKRFFGGGTQTATGEDVSWEAIKQKLLEIIEHEDKSNPLSDEDLVAKLSEAGYPVARRTVTKYRKMLKIQSSRQRKVWTE